MRALLGTQRTGTVFIEDFDEGMARSLGAELIDINLDGESAKDYAVSVPTVVGPSFYGGMVPVIFENPDEALLESKLPHINIMRTAIDPALDRWHSGGYAYRIPAPTSKIVNGTHGRSGPDLVEKKGFAYPYDITYDIHCRAKRQVDANALFRVVGRAFPPVGPTSMVTVTDTEGYPRTYDAVQTSVPNLAELAEVSRRIVGHTVSVRVMGELDFNDPYVQKTAIGVFFSATSN